MTLKGGATRVIGACLSVCLTQVAVGRSMAEQYHTIRVRYPYGQITLSSDLGWPIHRS
jgi:hypothetical protein